ncbi:hypothetical protein [Homoserinibacter sp. GY 40078]|uniref:hypothetical protein n=1 Tax=Homoserinibacter sp. GY 40078 TaxID=2603275 RepID=UPI0011C6F0FF|nr:hypothetical protein [Homoserinibacter sp. GY 40078]TXK19567.1 hypothetical protein FVQ89_06750 [Homoserinibacter sp. GY 40078]
MPTRRKLFAVAPRDLDPTSWFIGPYVPVVFGLFVLVYGGLLAALTWGQTAHPLLQFAAVGLCVLACLLVHILTRSPVRAGVLIAAVVVVLGGAGLVVSAIGYAGSDFSVELWWAPFSLGITLATLAPYLPAVPLAITGGAVLATSVPIAFVIIDSSVPMWGPVTTLIIVALPVLTSTLMITVFSATTVSAMLPIVDNRSREVISTVLEPHPDDEETERTNLARLTARAVPFLRTIARRGTVEPLDRAVAGEIARYLRDDLVSRTDLAWIGLPADDRRVVVIDPDRRADVLRPAQRTAIRDLVNAILNDSAVDAASILIELRAQSDGSTAIAISFDADQPEGRKVRHLAPYYFNLRGEVADVRLERSRLSFRVPPADRP